MNVCNWHKVTIQTSLSQDIHVLKMIIANSFKELETYAIQWPTRDAQHVMSNM